MILKTIPNIFVTIQSTFLSYFESLVSSRWCRLIMSSSDCVCAKSCACKISILNGSNGFNQEGLFSFYELKNQFQSDFSWTSSHSSIGQSNAVAIQFYIVLIHNHDWILCMFSDDTKYVYQIQHLIKLWNVLNVALYILKFLIVASSFRSSHWASGRSSNLRSQIMQSNSSYSYSWVKQSTASIASLLCTFYVCLTKS